MVIKINDGVHLPVILCAGGKTGPEDLRFWGDYNDQVEAYVRGQEIEVFDRDNVQTRVTFRTVTHNAQGSVAGAMSDMMRQITSAPMVGKISFEMSATLIRWMLGRAKVLRARQLGISVVYEYELLGGRITNAEPQL
jgi:hypothetical protein